MYSGVGVALTAAKTLERNRHREREREGRVEKITGERERDAYKRGVSLAAVSTPRNTPPPLETKEGVTAVTRSLRGVIVV